MKIALFSDSFLPQINGVVTATITLAKELTRRGHEVHVLAPEYKEFQGDSKLPFPVKRFAAFPAFFYEDFKWAVSPNPAVNAYIHKHAFDIIHFQTPMALGFQSILIGKFLKKPIVGTFHTFFADPDYLKHIKMDNKFVERFGWFYSNQHYNRCDVVTVPSKQTGVELREHGCKPPIHYISNGIDLSQFDNSKAEDVRKTYGFKEGDIVFLFVGRLAHEKNMGTLIRDFAHAANANPRLKLLVVGGGPQEEEYRALAGECDKNGAITFTGRIEHDDLVVSGIFGACQYFVTLSRTENQPVTILEAQANGLIPVCLPVKGLKSMIEHGKTGYFLAGESPEEFTTGIEALLGDEALLETLRREIKTFIDGQSIASIVLEWEALYRELIEQKAHKTKAKGSD